MATYNHSFTISFVVPNSKEPKGHDCIEKEIDLCIKALEDRITELRVSPTDAMNAIDDLHDTYEN